MWSNKRFIVAGLIVSGILAGVVALFASSSPDGLEKVAIETGFADNAKAHATSGSPLANYRIAIFGDSAWGSALAGIVGIAITGLVAWLLFAWLRRKKDSSE